MPDMMLLDEVEWTQWEEDGWWESDAGMVEEACGEWFAYPNVAPEPRLAARGPHADRETAMRATVSAWREHRDRWR